MASIFPREPFTSATSRDEAAPRYEEPPPPTVRFSDIDTLFEIIDRISGDFLLVTGVSVQSFAEFEKERQQKRRKFRLRRYHHDSGILAITIPTVVHEKLHLILYDMFLDQLRQGGKKSGWGPIGSATPRPRGHPGGDGGEGDSSGGPRQSSTVREHCPTLVIEAGDSEPLTELRNDMRWWFSASDHKVKIVLLAKIERRQRVIVLERWQEQPRHGRQGPTSTRSSSVLQPHLQQTITVQNPTQPVSYHVTRGDLILPYGLLFDCNPGPQDQDVVITVSDLEDYADQVWEVAGN